MYHVKPFSTSAGLGNPKCSLTSSRSFSVISSLKDELRVPVLPSSAPPQSHPNLHLSGLFNYFINWWYTLKTEMRGKT